MNGKKKAIIYEIIKTTAGGFHAWVKSNVGIIRKPFNDIKIEDTKPPITKQPQEAEKPLEADDDLKSFIQVGYLPAWAVYVLSAIILFISLMLYLR